MSEIKKVTLGLAGEVGKVGCLLVIKTEDPNVRFRITPAKKYLRPNGIGQGSQSTAENMSWANWVMQVANKTSPVDMPGYLHEITDTIPGGETLTQTVLYIQSNDLSTALGKEGLDKDKVVILGTVEEVRTAEAKQAAEASK